MVFLTAHAGRRKRLLRSWSRTSDKGKQPLGTDTRKTLCSKLDFHTSRVVMVFKSGDDVDKPIAEAGPRNRRTEQI